MAGTAPVLLPVDPFPTPLLNESLESLEWRIDSWKGRNPVAWEAKRYRDAIATVCERFVLPSAARKILETALRSN